MKVQKHSPLRAFLFSLDSDKEWVCQNFNAFEQIHEAALSIIETKQSVALIHVAFTRPNSEDFKELESEEYIGKVLLTRAALGTLPDTVRYSSRPVFTDDNFAAYLVLDGFGYHIEDPSSRVSDSSTEYKIKDSEAYNSELFEPAGWVLKLCIEDPALKERLREAGIQNEMDYILKENSMMIEDRLCLATRRFSFFEGENPNQSNIIDGLASAPWWLLEAPVEILNLSTRARNACDRNDIFKIKDLLSYSKTGRGLLSIPNLGMKTINDICSEIVRCFRTGEPLRRILYTPSQILPEYLESEHLKSASLENEINNHFMADDQQGSEATSDSSFNVSDNKQVTPKFDETFISGFLRISQTLNDNQREAWWMRIGYQCEPMTLESIGQQLGVTRERIRQISEKAFTQLGDDTLWTQLSHKVLELLEDRDLPLYVVGLPVLDPWFTGVEDFYHVFQKLSEKFDLGFHCWPLNEDPIVTKITQEQYESDLEDAKSLIETRAKDSPTVQEVEDLIKNVYPTNAPELSETLWSELLPECTVFYNEDGCKIITGYGDSYKSIVEAILRASPIPLHTSEIAARAKEQRPELASERVIEGPLNAVGVLYGRGTYGLRSHCPFTEAELANIREQIEDFILASNDLDRQWHAQRLCNMLIERDESLKDKLTQYIVNLALEDSEKLVYLRRSIWAVKGRFEASASERLNIKEAIVTVLERTGHPMTTDEIRDAIQKERGLSQNFQIFSNDEVVKLGQGLWGLRSRDIDNEKIESSAARIIEKLKKLGVGMHYTEAMIYLSLDDIDEIDLILDAGEAGGLRSAEGDYLYLGEWGGPRRFNLVQAIDKVMSSAEAGLGINVLHKEVERLVKKNISRRDLVSALKSENAIYDSESDTWKLVNDTEHTAG